MNIVERSHTHYTAYNDRPIDGIVLHDTEGTSDLSTFQSAGGWHWLVGRAGALYRDVPEPLAAWHVERTDRWRPDWVRRCPDGRVSDANYCTVGIEIVSAQVYRDAGVPYTEAQYATLRWLLGDLYRRRGALPIVYHGELQRNRSDPVALDPVQARIGPLIENGHYLLDATPPEEPSTMEPYVLTDAELAHELYPAIFGALAVSPEWGIPQSWMAELRAGRYRGRPLGSEIQLPGGAVYQEFQHGLVVWRDGRASWNG